MGRRTVVMMMTAALGAGTLAGCGGDEPGPAAGEGTTEATVTTAVTELGPVLVDGEGRTLYLFTQDSPGTSSCTEACLEAWPPLEGEQVAGEGVDEQLLGTIERDDGTVQATYADLPLYYYAQDTGPGDLGGQGVNEVWFVVSPDGEAVTEAPPPAQDSGLGY